MLSIRSKKKAAHPAAGMAGISAVYTDVIYGGNQERRGRKLLKIALSILAVLGGAWTVALSILGGINAAVFLDAGVVAIVLALLAFGARIPFRTLAHLSFWICFAYIWFVALVLEGIGEWDSSAHLWFFALLISTFLLLIKEKPWLIATYTAILFVSFALCEFHVIENPSVFGYDEDAARWNRTITYFSIFGAIILLTQAWSKEVRDAEENLAIANNKLEELLANMLPRPISERLRREGKTFADGIAQCSVLFTDIVGFTPMSANMTPENLVRLLDEIFSKFDELATEAGLEKIKTIGDAYMVASGLPVARTDHAAALIALAIKMREAVQPYGLHIRAGINSGSVVAGVIGKKKFIYDLWGDTVNVASRMESQGVVDEIQVTKATAMLVDQVYELTPRGEISIKGKGNMPVFLVKRERTQLMPVHGRMPQV